MVFRQEMLINNYKHSHFHFSFSWKEYEYNDPRSRRDCRQSVFQPVT